MSLLIAAIVKNKSYFAWNLLYLSKERPRQNLKVIQYQISTRVI